MSRTDDEIHIAQLVDDLLAMLAERDAALADNALLRDAVAAFLGLLDRAAFGLAGEVAAIRPRRPCPHGDPFCPCQDGDLCHYEAAAGPPATAAWPCEHCEAAPKEPTP